jgi:phenylacetate-CoA ligase
VPFYRDYLKAEGLSLSDFTTIGSVRKFPVVDRSFIQSQEIERLINASVDVAELPPASFTSGSSGKPLKLYATREFYISAFHIMQLSYGGSLPFVVAAMADDDGALPFADDCQVHFISRKSNTERLFARLCALKPHIAMLRPDRWRILCDEFGRELSGLNLTVAGVSGIASTPDERAYFGTFLGCPVANMYGATELGGGIFECPHGREHVLAHQNYLEILDDDGRDVKAGDTGQMVWTSLDNTIMPFIRYRIGDSGAFSSRQACSCGWNGPIVDTIGAVTKDAVVYPNGLRNSVYHFNVEIHRQQGSKLFRQYQLIQERRDLLRFRVVKSNSFNELEMQEMLTRLRELLRGEIVLEVTFVEHIEQTGNKFRFFVPLDTKG